MALYHMSRRRTPEIRVTEPVHRSPLCFVVQKVLRAKIRTYSADAALEIAESCEVWSESDPEVIDVIEET